MGCSASSSLVSLSPDTTAAGLSREQYEMARAALSHVRVQPPVQRRRPCSVGLPEEEGVYWVYWRPHGNGRETHQPLRAVYSGPTLITVSEVE